LAKPWTRGPPGLYDEALIPWLVREMDAGRLTQVQKDRLFDQMPSLRLFVRPTVLHGDDAPLLCTVYGGELGGHSGQHLGWRSRLVDATVSVDGKEPYPIVTTAEVSRFRFSKTFKAGIPIEGEGLHELAFACRVEYWRVSGEYDRETGHYAKETLQKAGQVRAKGQVRVVPDVPENHVRVVRGDAGVEAKMRGAMGSLFVQLKPGQPAVLRAVLGPNDPPVGLAFSVTIRAAGKEYPLGTIAEQAHVVGNNFDLQCDYDGPAGIDKVDLILRPDESVARRDPFVTEMWGGQLEFKDVPVTKSR
jgi:hypothetical protein